MSVALKQLIESFKILPGVGQKTAQRMAYYLLENNRSGARELSQNLADAMEKIGRCGQCQNFTEQTLCEWCSDSFRDAATICLVETAADQAAIENSGVYEGLYFVLHGRLSPLDGIGVQDLGIDKLENWLKTGTVKELILATSATVEGEATADYVNAVAGRLSIQVTRIAHGVPLGGELEYIDKTTLAHALGGRLKF